MKKAEGTSSPTTCSPHSKPWDTVNIRAYARFRPPEQAQSPRSPWSFDCTSGRISCGSGSNFLYDGVLPPGSSNHEVFQNVAPLLCQLMRGINMSVLCYGQTNSGKTHTIFGADADEGIVPRSIRWIFQHLAEESKKKLRQFRVAISFLEVYNEVVRDLLNPSALGGIPIREKDGITFVDGATICVCADAETALKWLTYGNANRTIGSSHLNDRSSRAHTIFSLSIATSRRNKEAIVSRGMFVDLAGSETLSYNFGASQQSETKSINLSLFALSQTVKALAAKEKFVPVRESALTRILSPCLINSVTTMIVTCSCDEANVATTMSTLRFGELSKQIEQKVVTNKACCRGTTRTREVDAVMNLNEVSKPLERAGDVDLCVVQDCCYDTRQGKVAGKTCTPVARSASGYKQCALFLHAYGNGCSGDDFLPVMRFLSSTLGFVCFTLDFPGFGKSSGSRQTSRTESLNEPGGPMEIVYDVLTEVSRLSSNKKVLVVGWDWGGNMSLVLALSPFRDRLLGLCLYHPSFTQPLTMLRAITLPVLLMWIPSDQLHLFSTGKKMAAEMKNSKLVSMVSKRVKKDHDAIWAALCVAIEGWLMTALPSCMKSGSSTMAAHTQLTRHDNQPAEFVSSSSPSDEEDDDDDCYSSHSSFLATLLCDPAVSATGVTQAVARQPKIPHLPAQQVEIAVSADALSNLKQWIEREVVFDVQAALLNRGSSKHDRPKILGMLGTLPTIRPHQPLTDFQQAGIFVGIPSDSDLQLRSYRAGRPVFVCLPAIESDMRDTERFMKLRVGDDLTKQSARAFGTYRARIVGGRPEALCEVEVPTTNMSVATTFVKWSEVDLWNQPTRFAVGPRPAVLVFEDAIICNYENIVMRCKLAEIALAISPLVDQIALLTRKALQELSDRNELLGPENSALLQLQRQAVAVVRSKMNMIHHVHMGKDPERYCVPDCGKLATFGQWHCHGMASVFASLLLPFSQVLHIDVRYRDGFYYKDGRDGIGAWDGTPRSLADHTWLEVTFFPSCQSFVADPSFDHEEGVTVPVLEAYSLSGRRFPVRGITNGSIEPFSGSRCS